MALTQRADVTEAGNWVFQAFLTPQHQVEALVRYGLARGWRRYAILAPESAYGRTFARLFQDEVTKRGGEVVVQETYPPEARTSPWPCRRFWPTFRNQKGRPGPLTPGLSRMTPPLWLLC